MAVRIAANTADFKKGLNDVKGQVSSFTSSITKIGGLIGVAFGVKEVAGFVLEISKLAGEAEGVRAAFNKLPQSVKLLNDLKEATAGTVSELDLMKRTVQANNFGIALQSLPDLLKFASIRAQQTGQSVDYLVDSIITGIGRKSPLILDNLGISAVRLKEQFGGAALEAQSIGDVAQAVGRIASEELKKMGDFSENASTKTQRLSAEFENLKVALGDAANGSGFFGEAIDATIGLVQKFTAFLNGPGGEALSKYIRLQTTIPRLAIQAASAVLDAFSGQDLKTQVDIANNLLGSVKFPEANNADSYNAILANLTTAAEAAGKKLIVISDGLGRTQIFIKESAVTTGQAADATKAYGNNLEGLEAQLKSLNSEFEKTDIKDQKNLATIGQKIIAIDAQIKKLNELRKASESYGNTLSGLNKKLSELNDQYAKTDINDKARLNSISQEIVAIQALIRNLESLKKVNEDIATQTPTLKTTGPTTGATAGTSLFDSDEAMKQIMARAKQIKKVTVETGEEIQGVWIETAGMISGAISDIAFSFGQAIAGTGNFGDAILKAVLGFAKQLGEILIASSIAMIAAKKLLNNPYTALAAGIALVAIAGAASAALQGSQDSFNSGGSTPGRSTYMDRTNWREGIKIEVTGEMEIRGDRLVYIINRQGQLNSRTRG